MIREYIDVSHGTHTRRNVMIHDDANDALLIGTSANSSYIEA